ncbi:MAG: MCE family protein [Planctomycetes bacterium]|nr:MCE family protein [Planctomycetota bacterium]
MNDQAMRFRLGIFVLGALILLAVLITLFGGFPNYFKRVDSYTIVFEDAQGLTPGTPVRRSGVRIGEVRKLQLDNATGKVHVGIEVEDGFTIRKADKPTLIRGMLGSDTSVTFAPPGADEKGVDFSVIPPGSVIVGVVQTDIQAVVQKTGELMPPAQEAIVEIKKVFQRLDKLTPLMEETLKEYRDVGKEVKKFVPEISKTNQELRELIKATQDVVPEFKKTNAEIRELIKVTNQSFTDFKKTNEEFQLAARYWSKVGERIDVLLTNNEEKITKSITRLEETLKRIGDVFNDDNQKMFRDILKGTKAGSDHLEGIAKNTEDMIRDIQKTLKRTNESLEKADSILLNMDKATKPFADRSPAILKNLEESTDKLNKTLTDLREVYREIARGDGTFQKLLSDPALYNNMNDAATMVTRILPRVDRALRDLEIFADKIARHPEALGLGGVVRPSSGLKESPSTILPWRLPGH